MELTTETRQQLMDRLIKNLPVLRAKLGMSQTVLANKIGLARQTIVNIETRKRPMMWQTFLSLLMLFYCNPKTASLLLLLGIYTPEFEAFLTC